MINNTPNIRGMNRDLYTRIPNGNSHNPDSNSNVILPYLVIYRNSIAISGSCAVENVLATSPFKIMREVSLNALSKKAIGI